MEPIYDVQDWKDEQEKKFCRKNNWGFSTDRSNPKGPPLSGTPRPTMQAVMIMS